MANNGYVVTSDVEEEQIDQTIGALEQVGADIISVIRPRREIRTVVKRED